MVNVRYRKIRVFVLVSVLIGVFLSVIQALGYFTPIDAAIFGSSIRVEAVRSFQLDGLLAIFFFAVMPGVTFFIWTQQRGLLYSLLALVGYWAGAWWLWTGNGQLLPIIAPGIAVGISVIRAMGWKPVVDPEVGEVLPEAQSRLYQWVAPWLFGERKAAEPLAPSPTLPSSAGVFLSYRREGGAETARLIREEFERRGISCFLDVEDLGASHFDDRLLEEIGRRKDFVVVLSPGCLARCHDESDWLRREIGHAIAAKKNVVPILKEGFEFPPREELPPELADLHRYNCVLYSHAYFSATMGRLMGFLSDVGQQEGES